MLFTEENIKKIKLEKKETEKRIRPLLSRLNDMQISKIERNQKTIEIINLDSFLIKYNSELEILDMSERPDFVISNRNESIGVELTDLVIRIKEKEIEGITNKIFSHIEKELSNDLERYKGIYSIKFTNDFRKINRKKKEEINNEIISRINNSNFPSNHIESIKKRPHNKVHIYRSGAHVVGNLELQTVKDVIAPKEKNHSKYVSNSKMNKIWLLLITGGTNTSDDYAYISDEILKYTFKSNFDKIFIFNFFNKEYIELKTE